VTTLDGVERTLHKDILLITDPEKAVGIGGVMGAGNSEIDDNTTDVLLEVAHFQPINIRQTAKFLKHRTDAVTRFEKGIDPTNIPNVMAFMVDLILHVCGGEVASPFVDAANLEKAVVRHETVTMDFDPARVNKLLGFGVKEEETRRILKGFDIVINERPDGKWKLSIPSYRPDIKEPADLIEDIGRMFGYQNIPAITPVNKLVVPPRNPKVTALRKIRKALNASGLDEVITYPFIADKDVEVFGLSDSIAIVNPLSNEYKHLRKTLTPSLSKVTGLNAKYFDKFGVYEIARKFIRKSGEVLPYEKDHGASMQPDEIEVISMMYYSKDEKERGIFHLKAALENMMQELGIKDLDISHRLDHSYSIASNGEIHISGKHIGRMGLLTDSQLEQYELDYPASYLEIELQPVLDQMIDTRSVKPFSKYQGTSIDYSVLMPKKWAVQNLLNVIPEHSWIVEKEIIDVYTGLKDVADKKSVTIRLHLQKPDANITASEVYDIAQLVQTGIAKIPGTEIRGGGVQKPSNYTPSQGPVIAVKELKETTMEDTVKAENNKIVVGKILEIVQHPNADKLVITKVDVGSAKPENTLYPDVLQVVTGAKNIAVGNYVPVALPGAVIPALKNEDGSSVVIKKGNLSGERSEGMMCSMRELGHGEDHSGIWILDEAEYASKIGQTFIY
jgi:phenylalanyl-tRNA synthetase beta chain